MGPLIRSEHLLVMKLNELNLELVIFVCRKKATENINMVQKSLFMLHQIVRAANDARMFLSLNVGDQDLSRCPTSR